MTSPADYTSCEWSPYPRGRDGSEQHLRHPTSGRRRSVPRRRRPGAARPPHLQGHLGHPGRLCERGESPAAACRREISEELGLDRTPHRLITVDWAPHEREGDKMLFLFDCGDLGADEQRIQLDGDELDRWEWVELDQLDSYVLPRIARRIRTAKGGGTSASYLEHGQLLLAGPAVT